MFAERLWKLHFHSTLNHNYTCGIVEGFSLEVCIQRLQLHFAVCLHNPKPATHVSNTYKFDNCFSFFLQRCSDWILLFVWFVLKISFFEIKTFGSEVFPLLTGHWWVCPKIYPLCCYFIRKMMTCTRQLSLT